MPKHRTNWTDEEDKKLIELVSKKGNNDWKSIADQIPAKTHLQCKGRWTKHLDPKLNKDWSGEQKRQLFNLHKQYQSKWTTISDHLYQKNRSDVDLKNAFYNTFRKGLRKIGKLNNKPMITQKVKQLKSIQIESILRPGQNDKRDFIYQAVFQCALWRENKDFQSFQRKFDNKEYNSELKNIYEMFIKEQVNKEKKPKKIDTNVRKNKKKQVQKEKFESSSSEQPDSEQSCSEQSQEKPKGKPKGKTQEKSIGKTEEKAKGKTEEKAKGKGKVKECKEKQQIEIPKQQQREIEKKEEKQRPTTRSWRKYRTYVEIPAARVEAAPAFLFENKNNSRALTMQQLYQLSQQQEMEKPQKEPFENSRGASSLSRSRTRSMKAFLQASGMNYQLLSEKNLYDDN